MAILSANEYVNRAVAEFLTQGIGDFFVNKGNIFDITSMGHRGDKSTEFRLRGLSNIIQDRDPSSIAANTTQTMSTYEVSKTKHYWGTKQVIISKGDIDRAYGSLMTAFKLNPAMYTVSPTMDMAIAALVASQINDNIVHQLQNIGLAAAVGAITNNSLAYEDQKDVSIDDTIILDMLDRFGDRAETITTMTMKRRQKTNLLKQKLLDKIDPLYYDIANKGDTDGVQGRVLYVTDSTAFNGANNTAGNPTEIVLGLTQGSIIVEISEMPQINIETKNGSQNIITSFQAQGAFTVSIKGYTYSTTAGGTMSELATPANWTQVATNVKDTAGVGLRVSKVMV
jgi:hypothetical protein